MFEVVKVIFKSSLKDSNHKMIWSPRYNVSYARAAQSACGKAGDRWHGACCVGAATISPSRRLTRASSLADSPRMSHQEVRSSRRERGTKVGHGDRLTTAKSHFSHWAWLGVTWAFKWSILYEKLRVLMSGRVLSWDP